MHHASGSLSLIDGVSWGVELHNKRPLDMVSLTQIAAAILAARGIVPTAKAVAGATVEYLNTYELRALVGGLAGVKDAY